VTWKLTFIHDLIRAVGSGREAVNCGDDALRAVVAGLKRSIGSPQSTG
jgi:hypothetical protein